MSMMRWLLVAILAPVWVLGACTIGGYEAGDSRYSYMRADFGMVYTGKTAKVSHMLTDAGDSVFFEEPWKTGWTTKGDTVYRALVYYDAATGRYISSAPVVVVSPAKVSAGSKIPADPLTIEAVWMGGGFLNIRFAVKTGRSDSTGVARKMGLVYEGISEPREGCREFGVRLFHDNKGIPEYYTVRGYMSMPLTPDMQEAAIRLWANTYAGEKSFVTANVPLRQQSLGK